MQFYQAEKQANVSRFIHSIEMVHSFRRSSTMPIRMDVVKGDAAAACMIWAFGHLSDVSDLINGRHGCPSFRRGHIFDIEFRHPVTFRQYFRRLIGVVETIDNLICATLHNAEKQFHIVNGDVVLCTEQIQYRRLTTSQQAEIIISLFDQRHKAVSIDLHI